MLELFKTFLADEEAKDMYITGRAGTGKTTDVSALVLYCQVMEVDCTVSAYTHKAVGILASKMPAETKLSTLHSFLGKRPTINERATSSDHVESNKKCSDTGIATVLFIDEYSMVGEKDYLDIMDAQDDFNLKVVWIGDPYQLPPVKDIQVVIPRGKYKVLLTEIKRQAKDNPLGETLEQLVSFIEGAPVTPLLSNSNFIRGSNIIRDYISCDVRDKVILAYTNKRVQEINQAIQGYMEPVVDDILFSPTTQKLYTFKGQVDRPASIQPGFGKELKLESKYRTLEHLIYKGVSFCDVLDEDGKLITVAYKFGHQDYKEHVQQLKANAADANRDIIQTAKVADASQWAYMNKDTALARRRSSAWRDFLSFNDNVICLDFAHALTVHKSQGSTYEVVFVDTNDIHLAASFSFEQYLKLMYVALSRASSKVVTN